MDHSAPEPLKQEGRVVGVGSGPLTPRVTPAAGSWARIVNHSGIRPLQQQEGGDGGGPLRHMASPATEGVKGQAMDKSGPGPIPEQEGWA